jgi:hypothetical protein
LGVAVRIPGGGAAERAKPLVHAGNVTPEGGDVPLTPSTKVFVPRGTAKSPLAKRQHTAEVALRPPQVTRIPAPTRRLPLLSHKRPGGDVDHETEEDDVHPNVPVPTSTCTKKANSNTGVPPQGQTPPRLPNDVVSVSTPLPLLLKTVLVSVGVALYA